MFAIIKLTLCRRGTNSGGYADCPKDRRHTAGEPDAEAHGIREYLHFGIQDTVDLNPTVLQMEKCRLIFSLDDRFIHSSRQ